MQATAWFDCRGITRKPVIWDNVNDYHSKPSIEVY
jgi:hypothetical protein